MDEATPDQEPSPSNGVDDPSLASDDVEEYVAEVSAAVDEAAEEAGNWLAGLQPQTRVVVAGAGVALVGIVVAAQLDIGGQRRSRLRGPRWLWRAVATTPVGVVLYGLLGTRGPYEPYPDLPKPTVQILDE